MPIRPQRAVSRVSVLLAASLLAASLLAGGAALAQPAAEAPARAASLDGTLRGSQIIGLPVIGMDHVRVGSIEDLLVGGTGRIEAVLIGVGGFLGIGEKLVAVPYDQVAWNLKDVSLTSGPTSVVTPENMPSAAEAAKVGPETMPGADTTRDVLGAVAGKHTGRVTEATGSTAETTPTTLATVIAGHAPLRAEIRMTKAQLTAAPAFQYAAARKGDK